MITLSQTVKEVMNVRERVWLRLLSMISGKVSFRIPIRFARIGSKMTMVSLTEKPMIVRIAATVDRLNSKLNPHDSGAARAKRAIAPIEMMASWTRAITAARPNFHELKRKAM